MRIHRLEVALLIVLFSVAGYAEGPDTDKVNHLATAISHAEGFGKGQTIPSRYHNPGDLKAFSRSTQLAGQVRIGKAGHIVFKDDEAGKAALRDYVQSMLDGRSSHYHPDMTFSQVAHVYAENWRPWVKVVSKELGVSPNTTLRAYFRSVSLQPVQPVLSFRPLPEVNPAPVAPPVNTPESGRILYTVADAPVHVPPLVEESQTQAAQRHKWQLLRTRATSGQAVTEPVRVSTAQDDRPFWR